MQIVQHVTVKPALPAQLHRLEDLAFNLVWCWLEEADELFARINPDLWQATKHNPVRLLAEVPQRDLNRCSADDAYLSLYRRVIGRFDDYMAPETETWFSRNHPDKLSDTIAYFSAEFGLHESLPIYSGGLGILSGDHTKTASDLGLPFIGIGFLYPQGYFHQRLDSSGWQEAYYSHLSFDALPVREAQDPSGGRLRVTVQLPGRLIHIRVWEVLVGRSTLYLMDTDIELNTDEDRQLSQRLYFGDEERRLAWETVFGLGGVRVLRSLGIKPAVWHMNEGHSAFMGMERVRELVAEDRLAFKEAVEVVRSNTVFTTHTPVPAGNDTFPFALVDRYFADYWHRLGIDRHEFMEFAQQQLGWETRFSLTVLALKLSGHCNGVSKLHGETSREMWQFLWPETPVSEVPIKGITNGVHAPSWIVPKLQGLYRKHLGADFRDRIHEPDTWVGVGDIPDAELWETHLQCKQELIEYARANLGHQFENRGESPTVQSGVSELLDPDALIIGFARRFATYKRATLLLTDIDRLRNIMNQPGRPVQIIFAGKAHPADDAGKHLIQHLFGLANDPHSGFHGKFVVLEDYDIEMGRRLVSGVDVWMNTPRRPHEASGTSGQKAAMSGTPNFSVLDGWWAEGYNGHNGWTIGGTQAYKDEHTQDNADAASLYQTLEEDIIPLYFERDAEGVPARWVAVMKESIRTCAPRFSFRRMLLDYWDELYAPARTEGQAMAAESFRKALNLAGWKDQMRRHWSGVSFVGTRVSPLDLVVGNQVDVKAWVRLGEVLPENVEVEAVFVRENLDRTPSVEIRQPLTHMGSPSQGVDAFEGSLCPTHNGHLGLAVRIRPVHPDLASLCDTSLVTWAGRNPNE